MTPKTIALREKHGILILNLRTAFDEGYAAGIAEERQRSQKLVDALHKLSCMSTYEYDESDSRIAIEIAGEALQAYESESVEKTEGVKP